MIFGDLFLEDVRRYREDKLAGTGISPVFPLWGRPTEALAREMIDAGRDLSDLRRPQAASERVCRGAGSTTRLLAELPATADPCGEKGEFHTFVAAGPMLKRRFPLPAGDVVEREGFAFADLWAAAAVGLVESARPLHDDKLRLQTT